MNNTGNRNKQWEVVGLIPAAGEAFRLAPLPCSKELFPVGFRSVGPRNEMKPKVVSHYMLEAMRRANIRKTYIILREGKWDIPAYYGDGKLLDMHIAYLMMDLPYGVPYTLDQAYPFVKDSLVALGFPDAVIKPDNVFVKLIEKQEESNADIVLGLFPASRPHKTDMVELDEHGRVISIDIKPDHTQLHYAWEIAVWTPLFSRFMHEHVSTRKKLYTKNNHGKEKKPFPELHVGDVLQDAINEGIEVESVLFQSGTCLDIGTPEDLMRAIHGTET